MTHWHRLGERCWCGVLTAPARFYWNGDKELSQEKVEAAYLEWLKEHKPERYKKLKPTAAEPVRDTPEVRRMAESLVKSRGGLMKERPHTAKVASQEGASRSSQGYTPGRLSKGSRRHRNPSAPVERNDQRGA